MAKTKINCLNCNIEAYVENKEIKRGFGKFCSRKCAGAHNGKLKIITETNVECAWCLKKFYKNKSKQSVSKSGLFFCSRTCKDEAQTLEGLKEIHPAHYGTGECSYREIAFRSKPKMCERCNYNANEAAIIVHHKDRNRENNDISNLEVLCCNCHAIEHLG